MRGTWYYYLLCVLKCALLYPLVTKFLSLNLKEFIASCFFFLGQIWIDVFFSIDINFFVNKNTCKQLDDNFESPQFAIKISFNG